MRNAAAPAPAPFVAGTLSPPGRPLLPRPPGSGRPSSAGRSPLARRPAQAAVLGAVGLILLFGLGYQIGLRRRGAAAG